MSWNKNNIFDIYIHTRTHELTQTSISKLLAFLLGFKRMHLQTHMSIWE